MKYALALVRVVIVFGFASALPVYAADWESADMMETAAGPAFETFDGTLSTIDGNVYVVDQFITDYRGEEIKEKQVRVLVTNETLKLHGDKQIGDRVRVEMTRGGFANSVE